MGKKHAPSRPAFGAKGATLHHSGKPRNPSNSTHFANVSAKVRPSLSKTHQTGKAQVPVHLTGSSTARTPAPNNLRLQGVFSSFTIPASASMTKAQQQGYKPHLPFRSTNVPTSVSMSRILQQRGKPQTSFKSSTVPKSAPTPYRSTNVPKSASMTKTQQEREKPQTPVHSFAVPLSATMNKAKHQKGKPQAPFRSTTAPVSATVNKTKQQRERNSSVARQPVTINKTQQQKRKRQGSTISSTVFDTDFARTVHKKGKLQEPIRSSNIQASGKISKTPHRIAKPQSHTRSTFAPASARNPKGTLSQKQETECLHGKRKKKIDDFFASKIDIDKSEKKASVKIVDGVLSKIMSHVKGQSGGDIYCPNHVKAGSYPVNTKIGKADEFDTNICLKLGQKDINVRRNGKINYAYPQVRFFTMTSLNRDFQVTLQFITPQIYTVTSLTCNFNFFQSITPEITCSIYSYHFTLLSPLISTRQQESLSNSLLMTQSSGILAKSHILQKGLIR